MSAKPTPSLAIALRAIVSLLEEEKVPYFLLGGLAIGVLGEPRFTYDIDLDIRVERSQAVPFLQQARRKGFRVKIPQAKSDAEQFGTFRLWWDGVQIDCILASTPLETEAFRRRWRTKILGVPAWLPSVEDLLLLKIIPGRAKDLVDARSLVERHQQRLDRKYLEEWVQRLCDEAEDYRFARTLQTLLK